MSLFSHLWHGARNTGEAAPLAAIERAVTAVEPMLKQAGGYPSAYREPVARALEHAQALAAQVPGPVEISRQAFVGDELVHALFPSAESINEALGASPALRDYLHHTPRAGEAYALMGVRRMEKSILGMETFGSVVRRDVRQEVVYFTGHTLEVPAPDEKQARQLIAMSFFDKLVGRVAERVQRRKRRKARQLAARERLMAQLHLASDSEKPVLQKKINEKNTRLQAISRLLELQNHVRDFEAVLLSPQQYLQLVPIRIVMDGMGIRRHDGKPGSREITFYDLVGFDRRRWTVALVHYRGLEAVSYTSQLEKMQRRLAI